MNIFLYNDNILVEELQDDLILKGALLRYDPDSPYMFCNTIAVSTNAHDMGINVGDILVIKRYAKEEYLPGQYFISYKDVRGTIPLEDYDSIIDRG